MLALPQPLEGRDLVAAFHRPLVLLPLCGSRHLLTERPDEPGDIPLQDRLGPPDPLPVVVFADGPGAGGAARADVGPETCPPGEAPAGAEAEERFQEAEKVVALPRGDERAVVPAVSIGPPGDVDPRVGLVGDVDVGVTLRVLEVDVVLRLVLLDQRVLKNERLDLGVGDDEVEPGDGGDEALGLRVEVVPGEVTRDPTFQVLCLSDVDDGALIVGEEVAPGFGRETLEVDHGFLSISFRNAPV